MAHIDYTAGSRVVNELPYIVYTRATWTDSWTEQPNMSVLECLWTSAPNINSAHLRWELGNVIMPGDTTPTTLGTWTGRGHFVRIDWQCDDTTVLRWVGFIESSSRPTESWGTQQLVCYGLEKALALTPIETAIYRDQDLEDILTAMTSRPFNGPEGRRANDLVDDIPVFADIRDNDSKPWSTRKIALYLLTHHLPTATGGVEDLTWEIEQIEQLPDWDQPYVETAGRTVWSILSELVTPERMLGMTVGSDGTDVHIRFFTHAASDITVNSKTIAENPNKHSLTLAPDALTDATFQDVGGGYDQVICRGARRRTICTLRSYEHNSVAPQLIPAWTESEQDLYDEGASLATGYDALTPEEKEQRNHTFRVGALSKVYRVLQLDPTWDYTLGVDEELAAIEVFVDNEAPAFVRMLPWLPITVGSDWSGEVTELEHYDRDGEGMLPFLTWKDPTGADATYRVANSALGQLTSVLENVTRSFAVEPQIAGTHWRELHLNVTGGPQHIIAKDTFVAIPFDDTVDAQLDFANITLTVMLEEDRHCEGRYPDPLSGSANVVRRALFDFGEAYQQINILSGTITKVTGLTGQAETCDGGYLVDESAALESLAEFIATSLLVTRQTLSWNSQRKISVISVGDLITTAQSVTINAPVTSIHMQGAVSINRPASAIIQSFECFRGMIDPLRILQDLGALRNR